MRRKFLSVLLAASMVLTLLPTTAWAAGTLTISNITGGQYDPDGEVEFTVTKDDDVTATDTKPAVTVTYTDSEGAEQTVDALAVTVGDFGTEDAVKGQAVVSIAMKDLPAAEYTVNASVGESGTKVEAEVKTFTITKADGPEAPTGLTGTAPVEENGKGSITGTTTDMEYAEKPESSQPDAGAWTACDDQSTEVAADKTYLVRIAATENREAGNAAEVTVPAYQAQPDTPAEIVKELAVTIPVPEKDGTPAEVKDVTLGTGLDKECNVTSITWAVAEGAAQGQITNFEAGKAYKATVVLTANADKKFAQDTKVTVDGAEVSDTTVSGSGAKNTVTFTATFPEIEDDAPAEKTPVTLAFNPEPGATVEYSGSALTNPTVKVTKTGDAEVNDADPVITWSVKGGADLESAPKDVGEYTVKASLPEDSQYEGEAITADVKITAKELTITADKVSVPFDPEQITDRQVEVTGKAADAVAGDVVTVSTLTGTIASAYAGTGNVTMGDGAKFTISGAAAKNYTVKDDGDPGTVEYEVTAIAQKIGAINGGSVKNDGTDELDLIALLKNAGAVLPETSPESVITFAVKDTPTGVTVNDGKLTATDTAAAGIVTLTYEIEAVDVNNDAKAEYTAVAETTFNVVIIDDSLPTPAFSFAENAVTVPFGGTVENALTVDEDGLTDDQLTIEWSSSNESVATVDENGAVTIVGVGTTTITVKTDVVTGEAGGNHNAAEASYILTVEKAVITLSVQPATQTIKAGAALGTPFTIKAEPEGAESNYTGGTLKYYLDGVDKGENVPEEEGTYEVRIEGATADSAKYEIKTVNGTLIVEEEGGGGEEPVPPVRELTITPSSVSIASGKVNTTVSTTFTVSGGTSPYAVNKVSGPEWLEFSISGNTVTISGTRPATAQAAETLILTVSDSGAKSKTVSVAVGAVTSGGGSGGPSFGGSSGGGASGPSVTVPVSGDDKSVNVSAKVSGSTATIEKVDGLDKVLDGGVDTGVVEIDLTALKKDIDTVKLPAAALDDIAKAAADSDNDVDGLAIKLDSGTVEFDADALEAIADQASGSTITLKLEKSNANGLNSSQKDAVKDMDIHGHFDLTLNGGKAITDFKGGRVSVKIPFTVPSDKEAANFVVIYVANDGSVEEMRTNCSGGYISFTTDHFSKYVIAYKAPEPVEPVQETPVAADCDGGSSCPAHKFTDVNTSLWYHKAVDYAINNSLMSGVGENTFSPNANLSRAMLAQILYNLAGRPAAAGTSDFNDVAEGMWYTNAIAWAAEKGVVSGLGNGKFGPNDNITREQLAVMLYRYAGSPAAGGSLDGFADAGKVSGYAQNGLVWATANGVMSGKGGGMLDPQGLATRAEVAQMLYNYLNK